MVGKKAFLMKSKHQYHLSQWGKCVYGAQSWNKRRLLRESMFITIDGRTLILKYPGKWSFFYKTKHQFIYPNKEIEFMLPNHEKRGDYYVNPCYLKWKMNFNSKNSKKKSFSYETKASISFTLMMRICLWCPIIKEKRILCESMFTLIYIWTLILRNEGKWSFSDKTKASIHLSQ